MATADGHRGKLDGSVYVFQPDTLTLEQWRRARAGAPPPAPSPSRRAGVTDEARRAAALLAQLEEQFGAQSVLRSNGSSSAPRPDDRPPASTSTPTGRDPATRPVDLRPDPTPSTRRPGSPPGSPPGSTHRGVGYRHPSEISETPLRSGSRVSREGPPCTTTT
jgi:hypothetical protein